MNNNFLPLFNNNNNNNNININNNNNNNNRLLLLPLLYFHRIFAKVYNLQINIIYRCVKVRGCV